MLEVFASIQGEGHFVGEPQTFVRLRGCPLRCRWCDTPGSWTLDDDDRARVASPGGARREPAWATPFQVLCWIAEVEPGAPRTVSLTGGEPLLWPDFVLGLRGLLGERRLHLETAGGHPRALARVLAVCDHVSLDLKLPADLDAPVELSVEPSAAAEGGASPFPEPAPRDKREWRAARRACLELARHRDAALKVVVAGGRAPGDFDELLADAAELAPDLPLVLQPVTPVGDVPRADAATVAALVERARELELAVRVVPQLHRVLGVP